MLAEDDLEQRTLLSEALRGRGYEIVEEANGGRLLVRVAARYRREGPGEVIDLIISDIRMPVCTGLDILAGIRNASWTTPVILMTAFTSDDVRSRAARLGAVILEKPFPVDALARKVVDMLASRGLDRTVR